MVKFRLEALVPGPRYNTKKLRVELTRQMKNVQEQVRRDFKTTVVTWKRKPKFFVRKSSSPADLIIDAGTDSEFYQMLDAGTVKHSIRPKQAKVLSFNPDYVAKTQVGVLKARSGGFVGNVMVLANRVNHPGTEGRDWAQQIADKTADTLVIKLEFVILKWVNVTHRTTRVKRFFGRG